MGMIIDESRTTTPMSNDEIVENLKTMVFGKQAFERFDAKERETLDKAWNIIEQYKNRLKDDLMDMLTELKTEIKEIKPLEPTDDEDWQCGCFHGLELMQDKCLRLIQEKINNLKENE